MQYLFEPQKELLTWVKKGDKNFYNEALAGVKLDQLPHPEHRAIMIQVPSDSENPRKAWVAVAIEPVITAIGHALGVWGSEGLTGQAGVKRLASRKKYVYQLPPKADGGPVLWERAESVYSVPLHNEGAHAVLADILGVGLVRAGTLAVEIKASLGIEFHCCAPDGTQWLA